MSKSVERSYERGEPVIVPLPLVNKSGLKPKGRAVLVIPYEPEIRKSVIAIPDNVRQNTQTLETRAVVLEAGPEAWLDEKEPRARVGDKVLLSRLAGVMARGTADGEMYRLVNDRDIFCQIEVENG